MGQEHDDDLAPEVDDEAEVETQHFSDDDADKEEVEPGGLVGRPKRDAAETTKPDHDDTL